MNTFDPLYKIHNAYRLGQIPQKVYDLIMKRFPLVKEGIKRVEEASGLNYPYYYAEPSLVISVSAVEFTEMGILFARTIPVVDADKQLHVFMHYLELINRILKMKVISDDVSSTLFEGTYADAARLVEERAVFKSDPTLIRHITTRFPEGFRDLKLEEKVIKTWMNKGLPTSKISLDANVIKIPIEAMACLEVEQGVKDKITEFENIKVKKKKTSYV